MLIWTLWVRSLTNCFFVPLFCNWHFFSNWQIRDAPLGQTNTFLIRLPANNSSLHLLEVEIWTPWLFQLEVFLLTHCNVDVLGEHFGWYYDIPNSFSGSKCILYFDPKNISEYLPHARCFIRCWVAWVLKRHCPSYWWPYRQWKEFQFNMVLVKPFFFDFSLS